MANEITTTIVLDLDTYRAQLAEAQTKGAQAGKAVGDSIAEGTTSGFDFLSKKFVALAAAIAGAFTFKKIIEEAIQTQDALNQFSGALAATGNFSEAAQEHFKSYAESLQRITTVADDVIIKNAALLVSVGRLRGEGLDKATKAALDLSAGLGGRLGVEDSFNLVAKAAEGNVTALKRYGIQVVDTGNASKNFAQALDQINARFGGAAERQTQTFSGALKQLQNNFNDILKPLGDLIIRSPVLVGILQVVSKAFGTLADEIKAGIGGRDLIGGLIKKFLDFGVAIAEYVIPPLNLLYNLVKDVAQVMKTGVMAVVTAASFSLQGLLEIAAAFSDKFAVLRDKVKQFTADSAESTAQFANDTVTTFNNTLDFGMTDTFIKSLNNADKFVNSFGEKMLQLPKPVNSAVQQINEKLLQLAQSMSKMLSGTVVSIVSHGAQQIGAALLKGSLSFADFKNFALSAMGDMCIHMGEAMLEQALGFAALAALIADPFTAPVAAAAFGLALIALGGVLKAAASSGGGGDAGAPALASSVSGGGVSANDGQGYQPAEREKPGTNVIINVQGNILDRRQTGLELADVMQETFGSNGYAFATGGA